MTTFISATLTPATVIIFTDESMAIVPNDRFVEDLSLITKTDIYQMDREELNGFQRSLAPYLGTSQEDRAKHLNHLVNQERFRRDNYGF